MTVKKDRRKFEYEKKSVLMSLIELWRLHREQKKRRNSIKEKKDDGSDLCECEWEIFCVKKYKNQWEKNFLSEELSSSG